MNKINNGNILFNYLANNCNPNGNPAEENMPRITSDGRIEVSDLRLKRYIRDELIRNGHEVYVSKILDGKSSLSNNAKHIMSKDRVKNSSHLHEFTDVRMFGGVYAKTGDKYHLTGPIQFSYGNSFEQDVEIIESKIITTFKTSEGKDNSVGSMGKDYRIKSATIGFDGSISARNAEHTGMTTEDLDLFDEAMEYGIIMSKSRSKRGQFPLVYMRLEYNDGVSFFSRNLTEFISQKDDSQDYSELMIYLSEIEDKIKKVYLVYDKRYFTQNIEPLQNIFGERLFAKEFFAKIK